MQLIRSRYGLRAMLAIVAGFACLFGAYRYHQETKPPRLWIGWLRASVASDRAMAAQQLGLMGGEAEAAVPILANVIRFDPDAYVRKQAIAALIRIVSANSTDSAREIATTALVAGLNDSDGLNVGRFAADGLSQIQADPRVVVSTLVKASANPDLWTRAAAIYNLAILVPRDRINPDITELTINGMVDKSEHVRELALYGFEMLVKKSPSAMSAAMKNLDVRVRLAAIEAIRRDTPCGELVLLDLIAALKDGDTNVRVAAALVLGSLGPAAGQAVPALIQSLKDDEPKVRAASMYGLSRIGRAAAKAIPIYRVQGPANQNR